jgi:sec-independent protein translocase protein TatB
VGFSLGEIFLLIIVGIIVVGPKRLPALLRTAGQCVSRLRRMSMDLRSQSGIDDLLRQEGLTQHINELRSLSRFNVVETLMTNPAVAPGLPVRPPLDTPATPTTPTMLAADRPRPYTWRPEEPLREREYPLTGCDAYGCLPDDAVIYIPPPPPPEAVTVEAPEAKADEPAPAPAEPVTTGEAPLPNPAPPEVAL